jgi:phosphoglycolate phosphatase
MLCDLDGTLVDSLESIAACVGHTLARVGVPAPDLETVRGYVGRGMDRLLAAHWPLHRAGFEDAVAASTAYYAAHCCDRVAAYPGVVEMLTELQRRGWVVAVVTNKAQGLAEDVLAHMGLRRWLAGVYGGDTVRKPDPNALRRAIAGLDFPNVAPDAAPVWMLGDHEVDVNGGRAAGVRTAWCSWGYGAPGAVAPDAIVHHPSEVLAVCGGGAVRAVGTGPTSS